MTNSIERQRKHFNDIAERYFQARSGANQKLLKNLLWGNFFQRNRFLFKKVKHVIEPMCGFCDGYELIRQHLTADFDYVGFDYSEAILEKAKQKFPTLRLFHGDVLKFRPSQKFDLAIVIGGLHHVPDHSAGAIKTIYDALNPGGFFINFEPTSDWLFTGLVRNWIYRSNDLFDYETERGFSLVEYNKMFANVGFIKQDQFFPGLLSYILFFNPDAFPSLNIFGESVVKASFAFDKLFMRNFVGRKLSFATLSLWQKSS